MSSPSPFPLLLSSLELSDAQVYEPYIQALLGTALHFCDLVVFQLLGLPGLNQVGHWGSV